MAAYRYLYPLADEELRELAYFFEFDFDGKEKVDRWSRPLVELVERWQRLAPAPRLEVALRSPDGCVVHDTRPGRVRAAYRFPRPEEAVLDYCDRARSFRDLQRFVRSNGNGAVRTDGWLRGFLSYLVSHRLMVQEGDRFVSLVLRHPAPGGGSAAWPSDQ
jgi:hypothetical protein